MRRSRVSHLISALCNSNWDSSGVSPEQSPDDVQAAATSTEEKYKKVNSRPYNSREEWFVGRVCLRRGSDNGDNGGGREHGGD